MDFPIFIDHIPKIAKENLLGAKAHLKLAPLERKHFNENTDYSKLAPRKAAVLMLFYPKNGQTHFVLIQRNTYPGVHSSQIAFPGGKVEDIDADIFETALRETHEEVGISPTQISIVRSFTEIYIPPSNFMVYPVLGISHQELQFIPQESEVASIIEVPLLDLLNPENFSSKVMDTSYAKAISVPTFLFKKHHIWGATAMILSELKEVLLNSFNK